MARKQRSQPGAPTEPGQLAITYRNTSELRQAEYNPRYMTDEDRASIRESLSKFGAVDPAVVNTHKGRENVIVGGNQRIKVAGEDLNWTTFPCVYVNLPLEREQELNVRLNRNQGRWDWDMLREFGPEFVKAVGFSEEEMARMFEGMNLNLNPNAGKSTSGSMRQPAGNVIMWLNKWNMPIRGSLLCEKVFAFMRYIEAQEKELSAADFAALKEGYERVMHDSVEQALDSILTAEYLAEAEDRAEAKE